MEALFFNVGCIDVCRLWESDIETEILIQQAQHGFLEGVVRGYRNSLLTQSVYSNLTQCENLEGKHTASFASWLDPEY